MKDTETQNTVLMLLVQGQHYRNLQFRGPGASMFGYSVLLHRHKAHSWLVVGAPVANSSDPSVLSPGGLYRCSLQDQTDQCQSMDPEVSSCGKTCEGESSHQWLGVSLSRQPGAHGGHVLACAHRWKNVYYSKRDGQNNKLPNGVCFLYKQDLKDSQPFIPCYSDHQRRFGENYGSCQAGISNALTEELIVMGAPGTSYWTGSVLVYNMSSGVLSSYVDDHSATVSFGSYLGYSVGVGHFLSPSSVEVVGGAPQYNQRGKVQYFKNIGEKGVSSLIKASNVFHVRCFFLSLWFCSCPQAELSELDFALSGSEAYAARFGEAIADLGDLDDDGYPDVAVGAPHEDELRGAVYLYNGRQDGISPTPSQRITGATVGRELFMFGQSLSSGVDIDDNGYQDIAVGAFLSDSAVVLRSRPVVRVQASVHLPQHIDQQAAPCSDNRASSVCINVTVCFRVSSRRFRGHIDLQYNVTADLLHKPSFPHRFFFHGNGSSNSTRGRVRARLGQQRTCNTHLAFLRVSPLVAASPSSHSKSEHNLPYRLTYLLSRGDEAGCSLACFVPSERPYFPLGLGRIFLLNVSVVNAGDDAFLPSLTLSFPQNIQYVRMHSGETAVSCDIIQEANNTMGVACGLPGLILPAHAQLNVRFLLDVSQNSTPGDIILQVTSRSDNLEKEEFLWDNSVSLVLPLKREVDISIHGHASPSSFTFSELEQDYAPVDCYTERLNYTYKVLNSGPSRSVDTVVEVLLPRVLSPHPHRLQQLTDWQVQHRTMYELTALDFYVWPKTSVCPVSLTCVSLTCVSLTCVSLTCGSVCPVSLTCVDLVCERLVCHLGTLESGKVVTIHLETALNPAVLLQAPVPVVRLSHACCVCVFQAGFFKRELQKKKLQRDSWDYVPKLGPRESFS
uniref:Integrin alpha 4 n=1 Tax=Neogobius melanostomus TaxID=47308 RepID=A0A8C6T589_9GOBI